MLALDFCVGTERTENRSDLAQRLAIPLSSYTYRAGKVGISRGKNQVRLYSDSLIGQWLLSLGITISQESLDVIREALKILCDQALLQKEHLIQRFFGQATNPKEETA